MTCFFHRTCVFFCALVALGLAACVAPVVAPENAPDVISVVNVGAYRANIGDVLKVTVYGEDDLSGVYTIGPDGALALPLVGSVAVRDQTLQGLPRVIAKAYASGYLLEPRVSVELVQAAGHHG